MNEEQIEEASRMMNVTPIALPEAHYFPKKNKFYMLDARGKYVEYTTPYLKARCSKHRLNRQETAAFVEETAYERVIDVVTEIAGMRQGVNDMYGKRVLVPREQVRIQPKPGDWSTVKAVLYNMLGEEQTEWLLGWLSVWAKAYHDYSWAPGQVVVLIGPTVAGKSLLQKYLTHLFGGLTVDPLPWMTGKSDFNGELVGACHLAIEDKFADQSKVVKDSLRENAKAIAVNGKPPD